MKSISIIVPIFNEEEVVRTFSRELKKEKLIELKDYKFKIIYINNKSTDSTK